MISPVTTEEVHFSTPMGTRGRAAPGLEFGFSPFGGTPMEDAPSGPSRPEGGSDLQMALLSLGRQLSGPPRPGLENLSPLGAPQATSGGPGPVSASAGSLTAWRGRILAQDPRARRGRGTSSCTGTTSKTATVSAEG